MNVESRPVRGGPDDNDQRHRISDRRRVDGTALVPTEKDFQAAVIELALALGWRCYHTYNARRSEPGFPDLTMVRDGRLLFAELKTERGRVTRPQREWLAALSACSGVEVFVWRPGDFDEVARVLARRAA